jgi:hypothetical protein
MKIIASDICLAQNYIFMSTIVPLLMLRENTLRFGSAIGASALVLMMEKINAL